MFSIDTNLLVYAHNQKSEFNQKATAFLEYVINHRNEYGALTVCLTSQVLMEFINVITRQNLEHPLSISDAIVVSTEYIETGIRIINQQDTQIQTFLELMSAVTTRKKVFDVALAATLKDHGIIGLYTANVVDFIEFDFLEIVNPLEYY